MQCLSIILAKCRRLFPPTKLSAELNAVFAALGFGWLVGEMEVQSGDVVVSEHCVESLVGSWCGLSCNACFQFGARLSPTPFALSMLLYRFWASVYWHAAYDAACMLRSCQA
jgi:hypothetical protein